MYFSMKKLSLLSLLWLVALVAMPTYAQDVQDAEDVVYNAEASYVDEFNYWVDEDGIALESADEDISADFNALFEDEEVQNTLGELNMSNEEFAWMIGLFAGMWLVGWVIALVLWILTIVALWKAFTRAGEKGWKAIIPIYNVYVMYKIAWMKNWFWYTILVAFVLWLISGFMWMWEDSGVSAILTGLSWAFGWIVWIVAWFKFARKYGWGVFASILFVLFYPICILVLGFGNYPYEWKKSEETVVEA